jgi:hypothetical protein
MPGMFVNAGPLFARAKESYQRTKAAASDRDAGQMDALVAIVFSVVALEGFINEAAELATHPVALGTDPNPPSVKRFAALIDEAERSGAGVALKFTLAKLAFTGETYDRGAMPYQDFSLLIDIRNALVHFRSRETFEVDDQGVLTFKPAPLLNRLRAKNIIAACEPGVAAPWLHTVATTAAARWACKTAATMVQSIITILPESPFKEQIEFLYSRSFQPPD